MRKDSGGQNLILVLLIRAVQRKVLAIRRRLLMIPELMVMTTVSGKGKIFS